MTRREELEKLASENPQELALLFAQKVEGIEAILSGVDVFVHRHSTVKVPDYLTDWTAVINAGKKAGIEWRKLVVKHRGVYTAWKNDSVFGATQQPDWPDCAALMIVMIEVAEATK